MYDLIVVCEKVYIVNEWKTVLHLIGQSLLREGTSLVNFVSQNKQRNTTQRWFAQQIMEFTLWDAQIIKICSIHNVTAPTNIMFKKYTIIL